MIYVEQHAATGNHRNYVHSGKNSNIRYSETILDTNIWLITSVVMIVEQLKYKLKTTLKIHGINMKERCLINKIGECSIGAIQYLCTMNDVIK